MNHSLKPPQDIDIMTKGGKKLKKIKESLVAFTKPGITLSAIEDLAQKNIKLAGGQASFAMVPSYSWATCINLNKGIVHGVPDDTIIKEGDVISIDVGLFYNGFHTDTSVSFIVSSKPLSSLKSLYPQKTAFLNAGKSALQKAIKTAIPGHHIGHISQIIQKTIESKGYSVVRNLTGHGIGKSIHQPPPVPCFLDQPLDQTPLLEPGLTLAIEAIYTQGDFVTTTSSADNWTISTKDGKLAAVFEETVAILKSGPKILTN